MSRKIGSHGERCGDVRERGPAAVPGERDRAARRRDVAADERDGEAVRRDLRDAVRDEALGDSPGHQERELSRNARENAQRDREESASDRESAADDRDASG